MGDRRPSKQLAGLLATALEISEDERSMFIRVARGEHNTARLERVPAESRRTMPELADLDPARNRSISAAESPAHTPTHRLPLQTTSLIGRQAEITALDRLFKDAQCRLLTLTGIGGIGKTRLAIEFGSCKQEQFTGGVFYIPLASVNSPDQIVPAIADVLGCAFSGPSDPSEQLLAYIAKYIREDALLIFDNLEHLLIESPGQDRKSGVIDLINQILQRSPQIKILATSRERLNVYGEWTFELHGLAVPPAHFASPLEDYDAIALFVNRAQRIRPDFQAAQEDQNALLQISQYVDGVPLALELAASWVGILSCQEIAREIKASMDFLSSSMRDIPERHRSIRATFDHSWKLLSEDERAALCRLSVFHGGFDREAAYQIAGASLPLLASLSAKSLVRVKENGRYDLHEVIRQYAQAHLHQHPLDFETHACHSEYYLAQVGDSAISLKSAAQQATIRRLTGEIDNIRAAWAWAAVQHDFEGLERAARGFGWYFEITGLYLEGIQRFEALANTLHERGNDEPRRRLMGLALIHQALLYFRKGEFERAIQLYEESIQVLGPSGDQALLADALVFLGAILHMKGEYQQSRSLQEQGLTLARQHNLDWVEAWAIFNLGYIDSLMGHYEAGYAQMSAGLEKWRILGDPQSIALGLNFVVPTLIKLGRPGEAIAYMQESIPLCEQSRNQWGMGTAYRFLGLAHLAAGDAVQAKSNLLKSLEIFGNFARGWDIARTLIYLGDTANASGDIPEAVKYYQEALRSSIDGQVFPLALDALLGLGKLKSHSGDPEKALVLVNFVVNHTLSEAETKRQAEILGVEIAHKLQPDQVEAARETAQARSFAWIVDEALAAAD